MIRRIPDKPATTRLNIMDMDSMDDDILHKLQSKPSSISNMHVGATSINGSMTIHEKLFIQPDDHVPGEDNPERLAQDGSIAQCPRFRVY